MRTEFVRNVLDTKVDHRREVNTYVVNALYNKIDDDGFASLEQEEIARYQYSWSEIEQEGLPNILQKIKREHNIEDW